MKHKIFLMCAVLIFATVACSDSNEPKEPEIKTLAGTSWKLVGFFDAATNELKVAVPEYEHCYILEFGAETVTGSSATNFIRGTYNVDFSSHMLEFIQFKYGSYAPEVGDGDFYFEVIPKTQSFSLTKNELKLFYDDNQSYLLFKARKIEKSPLADTKWKLATFIDVEKNEARELGVKECEKCFTLEFSFSSVPYIMSGRTANNWYSIFFYGDNMLTNIQIFCVEYTLAPETADGNLYLGTLYGIHKFELKDTELKLYCYDNTGKEYHLLFKRRD